MSMKVAVIAAIIATSGYLTNPSEDSEMFAEDESIGVENAPPCYRLVGVRRDPELKSVIVINRTEHLLTILDIKLRKIATLNGSEVIDLSTVVEDLPSKAIFSLQSEARLHYVTLEQGLVLTMTNVTEETKQNIQREAQIIVRLTVANALAKTAGFSLSIPWFFETILYVSPAGCAIYCCRPACSSGQRLPFAARTFLTSFGE